VLCALAALCALCAGALLLSSPALAHVRVRHSAGCARATSFHAGHASGCPKRRSHSKHTATLIRRGRACSNTRLRPTDWNIRLVRAATLCLINRERAAHGELRLRSNARLVRAAQAHTESMAWDDYFQHTGPGGQTPLARMVAVGYIYSSRIGYEIGENIAWGTLDLATPRAIVAAWMASPGHRANILDRNFRETGIGVSPHLPISLANGQPGAIYTQDFGVIISG